MSSPGTYKHLIANQNEYLNNVVNIPVASLSNDFFHADVKNKEEDTLNDVIHKSELFISIKPTTLANSISSLAKQTQKKLPCGLSTTCQSGKVKISQTNTS